MKVDLQRQENYCNFFNFLKRDNLRGWNYCLMMVADMCKKEDVMNALLDHNNNALVL